MADLWLTNPREAKVHAAWEDLIRASVDPRDSFRYRLRAGAMPLTRGFSRRCS